MLVVQYSKAQQPVSPSVVTSANLLRNFHDFSSLPVYENGTSAEVSTYDRTGGNDDGFNGTYSFIRRNADSTLVLFDEQGPGVINRIWTPTPATDTLEFFIDDTSRPAFSINYMDLFSGKQFPFVAPLCANQLGGYYSYLPIPFQHSCKIVIKAKATRFHQIGYRLYPKGTLVKSFSMQPGEEVISELKRIQSLWSKAALQVNDVTSGPVREISKLVTMNPGQSRIIYHSDQSGRIAGFEIISSAPLNFLAKDIDLKITWDGEPQPAVYCPLADYFGYAFGQPSMQGLLVGSDGKVHYSWFPMPYDKSATIELVYRQPAVKSAVNQVTLLSKFYLQNNHRDPKREGKFYAWWNHENPVAAANFFTMLNVKGRGHFAGVALQAQGLTPGITGFFEGDDSTEIDGNMRFHGTGSEDFFNGGWYALLDRWDDAMSLPLSGCLAYSIPMAHTGGYRFFMNDKMSFEHSFYQGMEHGPDHNQWAADYLSVAWYYCDRVNPGMPVPTAANTRIYSPDTLELYPQLLFFAMDENIAAETKWQGTPAKTMHYTITNESLLKFYLKDIPAANYDVYLDYRKGNEGAQFSLWQRQSEVSDWVNAYAEKDEKIVMQKFATIKVTDLARSLSFRFKTTPQLNKFILSRIILVKKQ